MIADKRQYCTFYFDRLWFGVEVERVQEVLRHQDMTQVPLAPGAVQGLVNLRGQIVTAIDIRHQLDLPDRSQAASSMNVVLLTDDGPISLLVDEIGDVLELSEEYFEAPPKTVSAAARELIRGVYKLDQSLLLILNPDHATSHAVVHA